MNRAVIGLGSNVEPEKNIPEAVERIGARHRLLTRSELRWTKPVGKADQPDFRNGAILIETDLAQDALVAWLKRTEDAMGRDRTAAKYGPRTIDLDLLVWNGRVIDEDVRERRFVRDAVREVLPEADLEA
jgi:2-amino-4-hydroxy-6-hydroxymethyldihydropteridine diphosphokinase